MELLFLAVTFKWGYNDPNLTVGVINLNSADLIKQVEANGWVLVSIRGSHHKFKHKDFDKPLIIPHPKKELGKGLVSKLLKQAGL